MEKLYLLLSSARISFLMRSFTFFYLVNGEVDEDPGQHRNHRQNHRPLVGHDYQGSASQSTNSTCKINTILNTASVFSAVL